MDQAVDCERHLKPHPAKAFVPPQRGLGGPRTSPPSSAVPALREPLPSWKGERAGPGARRLAEDAVSGGLPRVCCSPCLVLELELELRETAVGGRAQREVGERSSWGCMFPVPCQSQSSGPPDHWRGPTRCRTHWTFSDLCRVFALLHSGNGNLTRAFSPQFSLGVSGENA